MMILFESAFSPFARKVRMVLEHKQLPFHSVDGLARPNHARLKAVNGRTEVPVLVDGDIVVANSPDIVAYLEGRYPDRRVYPEDHGLRVRARAWERAADTFIDAILINISYWKWTNRKDPMPPGLLDAARQDLAPVYDRLDHVLSGSEFVCGSLSIADIALFPHLSGVATLEVPFSPARHGHLQRWFTRMRELSICQADVRRARDYFSRLHEMDIERDRIFWRGDRIEWLLSAGFGDWFFEEVAQKRVLWPGAFLP